MFAETDDKAARSENLLQNSIFASIERLALVRRLRQCQFRVDLRHFFEGFEAYRESESMYTVEELRTPVLSFLLVVRFSLCLRA